MKVTLTLSLWGSHSNMLLSAARYHAHRTGAPIAIRCAPEAGLPPATFEIEAAGKRAFVDYNDHFELDPRGRGLDLYAKRSVRAEDAERGVFPLGFHLNYSYGLHWLVLQPGFLTRQHRTEIARAFDFFGYTGWSHGERRVDDWFRPPADHGGRAIFYVRLWDPTRGRDEEERAQRDKMNTVRIEAVRKLRAMSNTAAGIIPDDYAQRVCPDLVLGRHATRTKDYGAELRRSDIGIANEGLKGSPGWKIGEYVVGSKAILTNEITSVIPGFASGANYLRFDDPREIPDLIARLRERGAYREMQDANWQYCRRYLHPDVYFERILTRLVS